MTASQNRIVCQTGAPFCFFVSVTASSTVVVVDIYYSHHFHAASPGPRSAWYSPPIRPVFPGAAGWAGPRSVTGRPPQASRKGWPQKRYRKAAPGQPQGLALLYTNASAALRAAPVYSRGTPCGYPVPAAILYCRLSCTGGYLLRVP